jgi:predicted regulator of Ras-like GTPase activity (Roadblock/LC7/MglB family)
LELERVLTKLKFDESVSGYALITNDGQPFLSFSLPDEVLPQIKGTLRIHAESLKLVNTMTSEGIVILARVDPQWVLAVLFSPELQLGGALSRTNAVVDLLEQVELPPPPAPVAAEEPEPEKEVFLEAAVEPVQPAPEEPTEEPPSATIDSASIRHGCVALRGANYRDAMTIDSRTNASVKKAFSNLGIDVLLVVDEKKTVFKIAEAIARPVEKVLEIVRWCVDEGILDAECPEEQDTGQKELVEMPLYEGKIDKARKEHRSVLQLCDGTRTLQEIATELGVPYFKALQSVVPYRGKTLRFIRTDKKSKY